MMKGFTWLKPDEAIEDLRKNFEAGVMTQEELQQTRDRLHTLFNAVSNGVFVFQKGEILLMNEEARNLVNAAETGQDRFMKTLHEKGLNTFYGLPEQFTFSIENSDPLVLVIRSCVKLKLEGGEAFLITVVDLSLATRLSKEVEYLSLNERKRISRDLHDGLSQLLSSLSLQAKALSLKYQDGPESENLQEIADRAAKCMVLGTQVYRKLDEI